MKGSNSCEDCFYYGKTRLGLIYNYSGAYNPSERCSHFKSKEAAEKELGANIKLTRLLFSLFEGLAELQPQIEKLEDGDLKRKLVEACMIAKQIKKLLG